MFHPHPSLALNATFAQKPHQGADPTSAKFLFVGLDANYAADIETSPIYESLLRYHEDGPGFWRASGVHHPFLLPRYKGDGLRYHTTFAKIGFQAKHADLVSFVELLHVPTVGRSTLDAQDLNNAHLRYLRAAMFESAAQFTFVSAGVLRLMAASGLFPELSQVKRTFGALRVLHEGDNNAVFLHLHFSNYGKFEHQLRAEAQEIAGLLALSDA